MTHAILVLLVEDEPMLLINAQDILEDGGFEVIDATSGADALKILDAESDRIVGLVTEMRLGGGADGWEVARNARARNPTLPVVYMTAESSDDWASQGVPKSILVQKPFAPAQLISALSTLLNEASSSL